MHQFSLLGLPYKPLKLGHLHSTLHLANLYYSRTPAVESLVLVTAVTAERKDLSATCVTLYLIYYDNMYDTFFFRQSNMWISSVRCMSCSLTTSTQHYVCSPRDRQTRLVPRHLSCTNWQYSFPTLRPGLIKGTDKMKPDSSSCTLTVQALPVISIIHIAILVDGFYFKAHLVSMSQTAHACVLLDPAFIV